MEYILLQLTEKEIELLTAYVERFTETTLETITEEEFDPMLQKFIGYTLNELQETQVSSGLWVNATGIIEKLSILHSVSKKAGFEYSAYVL